MDYKTPIRIAKIVTEEPFLNIKFPSGDFLEELICMPAIQDACNHLEKNGYADCSLYLKQLKLHLSNIPDCEHISTLVSLNIFRNWIYNKQIFTIDEDFSEILINTENIVISKDLLDHLPFKTFYLDLYQSEQLKKSLLCDGIFFHIGKITKDKIKENSRYMTIINEKTFSRLYYEQQTDKFWTLHTIRIRDDMLFHDIDLIPNDDFSVPTSSFSENQDVYVFEYAKGKESNPTGREKEIINDKIYSALKYQFLIYLASYNPDVIDNEDTKRAYKKPNPNFPPKNKFSEVQGHEVGYKIGTAFRKWKKSYQDNNNHVSTGRKKRPHAVRAHWRRQWYGSGENKEQRLIWINEFFTGLKGNDIDSSTLPAIMHKVTDK